MLVPERPSRKVLMTGIAAPTAASKFSAPPCISADLASRSPCLARPAWTHSEPGGTLPAGRAAGGRRPAPRTGGHPGCRQRFEAGRPTTVGSAALVKHDDWDQRY